MQKKHDTIRKFWYRFLLAPALFALSAGPLSAQDMTSESTIDWTRTTFMSSASLDLQAAKIPFPSGKSTASNRITARLPLLIKDALLSVPVDSSMLLGDLVLQETVTLAQLTTIIDNGKKTPGTFSGGSNRLKVDHSMSLSDIGSLLIKHNTVYAPVNPIETVASRPYTGIIIDARGTLPVQGEFITGTAVPCLFPKIWDDTMTLLYERNMMNPQVAKTQGIVAYAWSNDESLYADRIGTDPLRISARKIYGINRTDPVISRRDALRILSVPHNRELLTEGKIVVLLDRDTLVHPVSAPVKDSAYYVSYQELEEFYYENRVPEIVLKDTHKGIMISIRDLKFVADSAVLLNAEAQRLDAIAASLRQVTESNEYSILVEGHSASIGREAGEMQLSIERAQAIIAEMVARGVPENLFTWRGYGGLIPAGDNSTEEGRAMNRRVEITVMPKTSYIQRN